MGKRGRPKKPKRPRGRPIGSGLKHPEYPDEIRKIWRNYYHAMKKEKMKEKKKK